MNENINKTEEVVEATEEVAVEVVAKENLLQKGKKFAKKHGKKVATAIGAGVVLVIGYALGNSHGNADDADFEVIDDSEDYGSDAE